MRSPSRARRTRSGSSSSSRSERVHGLSELEHHVVGDVHHRRDAAQPRSTQALPHPQRRLRPRVDVPDHATDVARAVRRRFEPDGDRIVGLRRHRIVCGARHRAPGERAHLPGDACDSEAVAAVRRQLDVDRDIFELELVTQIPADRRVARELHDAVLLHAQPELTGRAQHALRFLAPDPASSHLDAAGQARPGEGERRAHARAHVGGPAHHGKQLPGARVDPAQAEPVRARMASDLDHVGDHDSPKPARDGLDAVDLEAGAGEPGGELAGGQRRVHPLPQPPSR